MVSCALTTGVQELRTDFTSMTETFCPSGYGVSNIVVHKGPNQNGDQDFRFTLKCVQLVDSQVWQADLTEVSHNIIDKFPE